MSEDNTLVAFHSSITSATDLNSHLAAGRVSKPPTPTGTSPFLRIDSDGNWIYSAENVEVEKGSRWAVDPMSLSVGFVCWADPKLNGGKRGKLGEVMGPCSAPPQMPETDHSEQGGEWKNQYGFNLHCVSGEDEGQEVAYRTSSLGGAKAYSKLYDDIMGRPSQDFYFPIVELKHTSYKNPTYNRVVMEPEFDVVDWADNERILLSDTDEKKKGDNGSARISAKTRNGKQRKRRST